MVSTRAKHQLQIGPERKDLCSYTNIAGQRSHQISPSQSPSRQLSRCHAGCGHDSYWGGLGTEAGCPRRLIRLSVCCCLEHGLPVCSFKPRALLPERKRGPRGCRWLGWSFCIVRLSTRRFAFSNELEIVASFCRQLLSDHVAINPYSWNAERGAMSVGKHTQSGCPVVLH